MVNWHVTKAVEINCGARQGCPLSALLFVIAIELLAQILRTDQHIRVIMIPGSGEQIVKCVLYMDDITFCIDMISVNRTLEVTAWFGQASGLKINKDKSRGQFYGPWVVAEKTGLQITVTEKDQKILGVKFMTTGGGGGATGLT